MYVARCRTQTMGKGELKNGSLASNERQNGWPVEELVTDKNKVKDTMMKKNEVL